MLARVFLFILFGCIWGSCAESVPQDLIPPNQLKALLTDMHISHAGTDVLVKEAQKRKPVYDEQNEMIFDKHQVTGEQFERTMTYYQNHPLKLDSLYARLIEEMNISLIESKKKRGIDMMDQQMKKAKSEKPAK